MSRARRLSEIAKANQPVFDSSGNQWWLADPSAKKEQPAPQSNSSAAPEQEPVAVAASAFALQDGSPQASGTSGAAPAPHRLPVVSAEPLAEEVPNPEPRDLPSRLSGFKGRFLSRGRRNRSY